MTAAAVAGCLRHTLKNEVCPTPRLRQQCFYGPFLVAGYSIADLKIKIVEKLSPTLLSTKKYLLCFIC